MTFFLQIILIFFFISSGSTFLHFNNNTFIEQLTADIFYTFAQPKPVLEPHLIHLNEKLMDLFSLSKIDRQQMAELLSGNKLFSGSRPATMAYAGHQFGYFTSQLGDGRALLLGQLDQWAFHAKGTGPNVYSRSGDGRAVLRSSIREYLISEAMYHLGIETTRALSLVGSTLLPVYRESIETAAIVVRIAPIVAFVRIGTFELFSTRHQLKQVRQLADFVLKNMYAEPFQDRFRYNSLLIDVAHRTGRLVAQWQAVGFTHGVLNTDNMNVLGSTIDYGPFGFIEDQIQGFVPNHSDDEGRYAFDRQPTIAAWNLGKFKFALQSLLDPNEKHNEQHEFWSSFNRTYDQLMREKLGFIFFRRSDQWIYEEILRLLDKYHLDYTRFWRQLADGILPEEIQNERWSQIYYERLAAEGSSAAQTRRQRMNKINPKYILRTYLAQIAIEKAQQGDFNEIDRLFHLLQRPFDEQPENEDYAKVSPVWAKKLVISCSS